MREEHYQVVNTLHESGLISLRQAKEVRAKINGMADDERERYLKCVIKDTAPKARTMLI